MNKLYLVDDVAPTFEYNPSMYNVIVRKNRPESQPRIACRLPGNSEQVMFMGDGLPTCGTQEYLANEFTIIRHIGVRQLDMVEVL